MQHIIKSISSFAILFAGTIVLSFLPAYGISSADQDSAIASYNRAFWDSGRHLFKLNNTDVTVEKFWTSVNEWQMIMDAWERSGNVAFQTMVSDFYSGFYAYWGTKTNPAGTSNWWTILTDSDGGSGVGNFNDDQIWAAQACARAYTITGNNSHRTQAKLIFDQIWARAYDTVTGGGVYWNTNNDYKPACVNYPLIIAALYLADDFSDTTYFSKAKSTYAWAKKSLFNASTGAIYDGKRPNGGYDATSYTYNQGAMIGAAQMLFKKTKDSTYYRDALLAASYGMKKLNAPGTDVLKNENNDYNQPGFKGILVHYMAMFAKDNNLAVYKTWLQHMAATVWDHRGPAGNLTYKNFAEFGAGTQRNAWEAYSGCNLLQVIPAEEDFINLTGGRPDSSNGFATGYGPALAVDHSVAGGSLWEGNATGDKWLSVNLGANCIIKRWDVQHAAAGGEAASLSTRVFRLQWSQNGTTWTNADTILGNAANQTIRDFTQDTARYVRLYITQADQSANTLARIYEFSVFGINLSVVPVAVSMPKKSPALKWSIARSGRAGEIRFAIPQSDAKVSDLKIGIYDLSGRLITILKDCTARAGSYSMVFDGCDLAGNKASAGFYVCRIRATDIDQSEMIFIAK
jgi:hypothetical protein